MAEFGYYEEQSGFGYYEEQSGFGYYQKISDSPPSTGFVINPPVVNSTTGSRHLDSEHSYLLQVNFDKTNTDVGRYSYNHREPYLVPDFFEPIVLTPPTLSRTVVDGTGILQSKAARNLGDIVLKLEGGLQDPLLAKQWGGAQFLLYQGPYGSKNPSSYVLVYIGVVGDTDHTENELTLTIRGSEKIIEDTPALVDGEVFAGTGVQPDGTDEAPPELANIAKPRIVGEVWITRCTLLDGALNIYQFDVEIPVDQQFWGIRDAGVSLTHLGATADMHNFPFNPGSSGYVQLADQPYIRLANPPAGPIVFSGDRGPNNNEPTGIFSRIFVKYLGPTPHTIVFLPGDIDPIPGQETEAGIFLAAGEIPSVASLFDRIALSIGGFWYIDRLNRCRLGRVDLTSPATRTILPEQVLRDPRPILIPNSRPVWRVNYKFQKNYTVANESDLANDPLNTNLNLFKTIAFQPNRLVQRTSLTVTLDDYPAARELNIDSVINNIASAEIEADRILALGEPGVAILNFNVYDELFTYDIAENIDVSFDGFQFAGAIVGLDENTITNQTRITVLGREI